MQKRKQEKLELSKEKQLMISKTILQTVGKKKKKGTNNDVGHFLDNYGKVSISFFCIYPSSPRPSVSFTVPATHFFMPLNCLLLRDFNIFFFNI